MAGTSSLPPRPCPSLQPHRVTSTHTTTHPFSSPHLSHTHIHTNTCATEKETEPNPLIHTGTRGGERSKTIFLSHPSAEANSVTGRAVVSVCPSKAPRSPSLNPATKAKQRGQQSPRVPFGGDIPASVRLFPFVVDVAIGRALVDFCHTNHPSNTHGGCREQRRTVRIPAHPSFRHSSATEKGSRGSALWGG